MRRGLRRKVIDPGGRVVADEVVSLDVSHRSPGFDVAGCHRTWSGLYEQCELDGNPIIGNWPGTLDNFHVCAGLSGRGAMHAPAAGRAIAEKIIHGADRPIDVSRFG